MPITTITYKIIRDMKMSGILPERPHILELGESNWSGDVSIENLEKDIAEFANNAKSRKDLEKKVQLCRKMLSSTPPNYKALWELSRIFYKLFLGFKSYQAVDLGGSPDALKHDLNYPIELSKQYDITIDFGTAEHVFNILQLFKSVHEATKPGGFIMHGLPFHGWVDHGFYTFQPTFFMDLAAANNYQTRLLLYWKPETKQAIPIQSREQIAAQFKSESLSGSGSLFTVFQKSSSETPFNIPMQGYYAGTVSDDVESAWHKNR